jgi:hypothetical protein
MIVMSVCRDSPTGRTQGFFPTLFLGVLQNGKPREAAVGTHLELIQEKHQLGARRLELEAECPVILKAYQQALQNKPLLEKEIEDCNSTRALGLYKDDVGWIRFQEHDPVGEREEVQKYEDLLLKAPKELKLVNEAIARYENWQKESGASAGPGRRVDAMKPDLWNRRSGRSPALPYPPLR